MNGWLCHRHVSFLEVVRDLDVGRSGGSLGPLETNPPLPVDADRVLPCPVAPEGFQAVAGERPELGQTHCRVENFKALPARPIEPLEGPDEFSLGEDLRPFVPVAQNHVV